MNSALIIVALGFVAAVVLGSIAKAGHKMNLEQWTVGGRGFGTILIFILTAGEIYTTFTFLGASGLAYSKGAAAYYVLCYLTLLYVLSYWLLPPIWAYAKEKRLVSQPDFFVAKYDSKFLGILVALVGIVALVPYLVLQFKGLAIIVNTTSYGAISREWAIWIGAIAVTIYVMISGVRGSAWTAVLKDAAILIIVAFLGIYLPFHYYGSFGGMFSAIEAAKPGFFELPKSGSNTVWFGSTVLLTALGGYMWPHTFGSAYAARDPEAFRRNAVTLPLYQLMIMFVLMVGFVAVLQVPGLTGADVDLALFKVVISTFDPWFVGVIGATGVLTALVPGSMLLVSGATLLANNIYRPLRSGVDDAATARIAKGCVPLVALVCVFFTLNGGDTIVALLLMGYNLVTQLFPSLVGSLFAKNPINRYGAIAGILAGVGAVAVISLGKFTLAHLFPWLPPSLQDINIGFVALLLNVVTALLVSFVANVFAPASKRGLLQPHGVASE